MSTDQIKDSRPAELLHRELTEQIIGTFYAVYTTVLLELKAARAKGIGE